MIRRFDPDFVNAHANDIVTFLRSQNSHNKDLIDNFAFSFQVSLPSIDLHVAGIHCNDLELNYAVPRFDIDLAHMRGVELPQTVDRLYHVLEKEIPVATGNTLEFMERWKLHTIHTLHYINTMGVGDVDWERVACSVPNYKEMKYNPLKDSRDPFYTDKTYVLIEKFLETLE